MSVLLHSVLLAALPAWSAAVIPAPAPGSPSAALATPASGTGKCVVRGTLIWPADGAQSAQDRIKARAFGPTSALIGFEVADWHQDVPVKDGRFEVGVPGSAPVDVSVFVARPATETEPAVVLFAHARGVACGSDLELELRPAPRLVGRAVDSDGRPLARVRLVAQLGSDKLPNASLERIQTSVDCDAGGAFDVALCSDGDWYVVAEADGHAPSRIEHVTFPREGPLELVLPRGGTVSGRIVDAAGAGVPDVLVSTQPRADERNLGFYGVGLRRARSGADGRFVLEGTCTGAIELDVQVDPPLPHVALDVEPGQRIDDVVIEVAR